MSLSLGIFTVTDNQREVYMNTHFKTSLTSTQLLNYERRLEGAGWFARRKIYYFIYLAYICIANVKGA